MEVPVFELRVSNEPNSQFEVDYVAGVDRPAIERDFMAFNAVKSKFDFAQIQEEQRIIFGAAMIPNQLIIREDEKGNPFKVFYTADTVRLIAEMFFEKGYQKNFKLTHYPNQQKDGVVFFQSIIKDTTKGIIGVEGDYPDGTWFLGAKVNNEEVWNEVKQGKIKGFSIEGMFNKVAVKEPMLTAEEAHKMIEHILNRTQLN